MPSPATQRRRRAKEKLRLLSDQHHGDLAAARADHEAQLSALYERIAALQSDIDRLQSRHHAEASSDATRVATLEAALQEHRSAADDAHRQLSRQLQSVRKEADDALRSLAEKDQELRTTRQVLTAEVAAAVAERDAMSRRHAALHATLDEERSRVASAESVATRAAQTAVESKISRLEEVQHTDKLIIAELKHVHATEMDKLKEALAAEHGRAEASASIADAAQDRIKTLSATVATLKAQLRDRENQVEAGKVQIAQMMKEVMRAKGMA